MQNVRRGYSAAPLRQGPHGSCMTATVIGPISPISKGSQVLLCAASAVCLGKDADRRAKLLIHQAAEGHFWAPIQA
jgi:hypothetical protein